MVKSRRLPLWASREAPHRDMPTLSAPHGWTFIDGPPRDFDVCKSAIMASDLVVIPVQPSAFDIWSARKIMDLIANAQMYKPSLVYSFAINRKPANTAISRDFRESLLSALRIAQSSIPRWGSVWPLWTAHPVALPQ